MFDWKTGKFTADYSLGSATLDTELPRFQRHSVDEVYTPAQTDNPQPVETGGGFSGLLNSVTATAETFLGGVQKVYELGNQISDARLQQKQIESSLRVQELQTVGGLDLKAAQLQAQKEIGIAQAQAATRNEMARVNSSNGGAMVTIPSTIPTPLLLLVGAIGFYMFTRRGA